MVWRLAGTGLETNLFKICGWYVHAFTLIECLIVFPPTAKDKLTADSRV